MLGTGPVMMTSVGAMKERKEWESSENKGGK
jgi:hypothetical protein